MSEGAPLTLIIGPQSRLALALNALIRTLNAPLGRAGLVALPNRIASPLLRGGLDPHRPISDGKADLTRAAGPGPAVLSAVNFFGAPKDALREGELFPNAENALAGLANLVGPARIVLAPDALPAFFLAPLAKALEDRVRDHDWETLYELSWAELAKEITASLPECKLLVLTPRGAATRSPEVLADLLGPAVSVVPDPYTLMKGAISQTGVAVLDRMLDDGEPDQATVDDLYNSFCTQPDRSDIADRLGMEKLTQVLLEERFREDLEAIQALPNTTVV